MLPSGKLAGLYKEICAKEQTQNEVNPECKSAYTQICAQIKQVCTAFGNEVQAVKVHLPKAAAKSRGRKRQAEPVEPVGPKIEDWTSCFWNVSLGNMQARMEPIGKIYAHIYSTSLDT